MSELLNVELKKCVNIVIQNQRMSCLESVQAMLVIACYTSERSLFLSFATRMALDLKLHEAYGELIQRLSLRDNTDESSSGVNIIHNNNEFDREERLLMRKARVWFGLLVLEHMSGTPSSHEGSFFLHTQMLTVIN